MVLFALVALAVVGAAAIFLVNRLSGPAALEVAEFRPPASPVPMNGTLSVTTWNIGYAGMGAEADFVMDLGEQKRPLSAQHVETNLQAIGAHLASLDTDVIFLQEAARPSFSTYQIDVLDHVERALPDHGMMYKAEAETRFLPPPIRTSVGSAIFSRHAARSAERRALPLEPTYVAGTFRKAYRMHILRLTEDTGVEWVLINVHLSTFDTPEDDVRGAQVKALMAFAQSEYQAGRHVVIGGDWNLRLSPTEFPHNTDERFRFWIRDFPQEQVPADWHWAVDAEVPTVRTAHKPYVAGENYVLIIDGFLVSPNVETVSVQADDLGFRNTDHHPVRASFRSKAPSGN